MESTIRRLKRAGANYVNSPYQMGGLRTAASILRPAVVEFLDLSHPNSKTEIDLEEVRVTTECGLCNTTVAKIEARFSQLRIIALKRRDQSIELVPEENASVAAGDHLVVIGEREQLLGLARMALPTNAA